MKIRVYGNFLETA